VNKSELIDHVASSAALDKKASTAAVEAILDGIVSTIRGGEKVSLLGFGVFTPTSRAARTGRNPRTGAPVKIAASKGVRFGPGSAFKAALNAKGATKKAAPAKAAVKAPAKATKATKAPAKATKAAKAPAKAAKSAKKK